MKGHGEVFVRFLLPDPIEVQARAGDTLLDAALENGIHVEHDCGGNCACTTCHVLIEEGADFLSVMQPVEDERLDTADMRFANSRLACQAILMFGPVIARVVLP